MVGLGSVSEARRNGSFTQACLSFSRATGLRMAATTATQTGQPSHPDGQIGDPTMIRDKAGAHGIPRRPPGHTPGDVLHQQGGVKQRSWFVIQPALRPIIPLFVMVGAAFVALIWATHRQAMLHPQGMSTKQNRKRIMELEDPEAVTRSGMDYMQKNVLRNFVFSDHPFIRSWRGAWLIPSEIPAQLPGDASPTSGGDRPRMGGAAQ